MLSNLTAVQQALVASESKTVKMAYTINDNQGLTYYYNCANTVSNGYFDSGTTGWEATNCTVASVGGELVITRNGGAFQDVAQTVTGKLSTFVATTYRVSVKVKSGTSGNEAFTVVVDDGGTGATITGTSTATKTRHTATFVAATADYTITVTKNSATAGTMKFDDIEVTPVDSVVLTDRSGVTLRKNSAESGLIVPSDISFSISNKNNTLVASDFLGQGGLVLVECFMSNATYGETKICGWKFRITSASPTYQSIAIEAEDFMQAYLKGDCPNKLMPEDIFPSSRTYSNTGTCIPVTFGTAFIPLRDVYINGAVSITSSGVAAVASVNGSRCKFTDTGNGLGVIEQGQLVTVSGRTNPANNGVFTVLSVEAGQIEIDETTLVDEGTGDSTTISHGSAYVMLGSPDNTYVITEVQSPRSLGVKSSYLSSAYTFNQYTIADKDAVDWRMFQAITAGNPATAPGYYYNGNVTLDPLVKFSSSNTAIVTNPADCLNFTLLDYGLESNQIDTAVSFAAAHITYDGWARETETELMPNVVDRDFSGASNWNNSSINSYNETGDLSITASVNGQYCYLTQNNAPTVIGHTYKLTTSVVNLVGTWVIMDFTGTQTLATIITGGDAQEFIFVADTTGGFRIVAGASNSSANFDDFSLKETGLAYNGGFWSYKTREKALADLLVQCHSCLDIGETIGLRVLSKASQATFTGAEVLRKSDQGKGTFTYTPIVNTDLTDSVNVAWQKSGEPQDSFLKVIVACDAAATVKSKDVLECQFVQDSKAVQRIGRLYGQRKYGKIATIGLTSKLTRLALQPDDVVTIDEPNYGGTYNVVIDSMTITDTEIKFTATRYSWAFDDWDDIAPSTLTIPTDTTPYAWQPTISGPQTDQDIGRSAFDVWGKEWLTVGPLANGGKFTDIQKALNAVKQAGGGAIYLLNGTYQQTAPLYVPDVNLEFVGQSRGGVVLKNLADQNLFVLHNTTKMFTFSQFSLESQNVNTNSVIIYVYGDSASQNTSTVSVENISATLSITGDILCAVICGESGTVSLSKSRITNGRAFLSQLYNGAIRVINNDMFDGNYSTILENAQTATVFGNNYADCETPIYINETSQGTTISENTIQGIMSSTPIVITSTSGTGTVKGAMVSGNIIEAILSNYKSGIIAAYCISPQINKNRINIQYESDCAGSGIYITDTNGGTCSGNGVIGNADDGFEGISINASSSGNVVSGNNIDCTNNGANDVGIYIASGCNNNQGGDNITSNAGTGIYNNGTGNNVTGKDI